MTALGKSLGNRPSYKWWVFCSIALGTFISAMDQGGTNIALPSIETHFQTDLPTVQWVVVGYALTISVLLLPMGRLGDLIERKTVYLMGMVLFVGGAALGGFATSISMLIAGKAVQGIGSAMLQSNAMATIISVFPNAERGKVLGLNVSVVGVAVIVGPALGGLLISTFGWRSVFLINLPLGLLAFLSSLIILDRRRLAMARTGGPKSFDYLGATLCGGALLVFLLVVSNGARLGWVSAPMALGMAACALAAVLFVRWELRTRAPMLDVRIFTRRIVALGVAAGWVNFLATSSVIFLMPFYFQKVQGYSPREAGLFMVPAAAALALVGPVSGRLSDRFGSRTLTAAGLTCTATALFLLATQISLDSSLALLIPILVLSSAGMGLFTSPNVNSIMSAVERSKYGVITALTQLVRNSGQVTSVAIATTIVTATMSSRGFEPRLDAVTGASGAPAAQAFVSGMHWAFFASGGLVLLALTLTLLKGERFKSVGGATRAGCNRGPCARIASQRKGARIWGRFVRSEGGEKIPPEEMGQGIMPPG